ncbi:PepSY domain-containing protein [Candidatus Nitrosopelagicus sp.]|nr:PepSY domain-containing protein [Candidatus Nitrosopelagicus sp.]
MKQIVGQLAALMLITVLVTSVAATPAFADWDKTKYPAIQGTIPIEDGQNFQQLSNISLVDAMSTAEEVVPDSKAIYGKLTVINGYLVYKVVMMDENRGHNKVLVDAGTGEELYVSDVITKDSYKNKRSYDKKHNKKMKDYFKGMTPEQVTEKKKQFKEMGDAWKSLSIQDRAAMIIHFMQMKMQWDTMSDEQKDLKKQEMKEQWKDFLPLSPEEKKQKLEDYVKSLKT